MLNRIILMGRLTRDPELRHSITSPSWRVGSMDSPTTGVMRPTKVNTRMMVTSATIKI